jgi:hypothetical protein
MAQFSSPTQYEIVRLEIDDIDVIGLFLSLSVYENIYLPIITGTITIIDSESTNFIEKYSIEGLETISFEFKNALGERLFFNGRLNGIRDKIVKGQKCTYIIDFNSESMFENEQQAVTKRYKNTNPEDALSELVKRVGGKIDIWKGKGLPINFVASRWRPIDTIRYILTHSVSTDGNKPNASNNTDKQEDTSRGTTGFLCWETLKGYRFASISNMLAGKAGNDAGTYVKSLQNTNLSMNQTMNSIISYEFKTLGDFQSKLRAGAFSNTLITMDIDKGVYSQYKYEDTSNMTEKQKELVKNSSRYLYLVFSNEIYENDCNKAAENLWDRSKLFQQQNVVGQNTFNDQVGSFTLAPRFEINAGDYFEAKLPKIASATSGGYDQKHTGRYIISQVGHHLFNDGRAYTKISTIRSTIQQNDASSKKTNADPQPKTRVRMVEEGLPYVGRNIGPIERFSGL